MAPGEKPEHAAGPPPVYVISGSTGASGEQLVGTALAQFPDNDVTVVTVGGVRELEQIQKVVLRARNSGGMIAHTLVDARLRDALTGLAREQGVATIDLMGPLLSRLAVFLGREPLGQPGLYRQLHRTYFDRVAAIEFTLAHDDGKNPQGWSSADVVLVGVSRTGKTPLSVYLSVLGWKAANVPLVPEVPAPAELFPLDRCRVVGLTIDLDQLLMLREQRFRRMGALRPSGYVEPETVQEEIQAALKLFRRAGFAVIDVTDKPIESSTGEIIKLITRPR